jgi:plastocyanin
MPGIDPRSRSGSSRAVALTALVIGALAFASPVPAAPLTVLVLKRDGSPLQGAVVSAEAESPAAAAAPPVKGIIDQVDLAFVPDVLVIPVHSTVQFPNSDAISHQVYSFSSARSFQLPLYRGKPYPPVSFDQPGIVTLGCNIHDKMLAYVVVTAAQFFGRTNRQGEWLAPDVPPARYRLRVWHPLLNETRDIERMIDAGAALPAVRIELARTLKPEPLSGHPHSWEY